MASTKKILVIRFNSIGDIILTSPVTDALHKEDYEVHYVCKTAYAEILNHRPDISKVWELKDSMEELIQQLKNESFDHIVDLHNNLRSKHIKSALRVPAQTLDKSRIDLFLMTQLSIKKKQHPHIVERFLDVIDSLVESRTQSPLSFYKEVDYDGLALPASFVCIAVGAAFYTKQIPETLLIKTINQLNLPVVLIGGPDDEQRAKKIQESCSGKLTNLVGQLSISESAEVIDQSEVLLTGDTGMMHLAAALQKSVVAVFGSTHPFLGYSPYYGDTSTKFEIVQNTNLNCRPCTKQGKDECPKGHFKCMTALKANDLIKKINQFI